MSRLLVPEPRAPVGRGLGFPLSLPLSPSLLPSFPCGSLQSAPSPPSGVTAVSDGCGDPRGRVGDCPAPFPLYLTWVCFLSQAAVRGRVELCWGRGTVRLKGKEVSVVTQGAPPPRLRLCISLLVLASFPVGASSHDESQMVSSLDWPSGLPSCPFVGPFDLVFSGPFEIRAEEGSGKWALGVRAERDRMRSQGMDIWMFGPEGDVRLT